MAGRRSPDHPVVRAVFEPRADFIASLVPDPGSASVLDVGSGNGFMTVPLEQRFGFVVNLDRTPGMLTSNPCDRRIQAGATRLPFEDDAFDIVTASHLLHHLIPPDRTAAISEMLRIARQYVVIYEPNRNNPLMFCFGCLNRAEWMSLRFSRRYLDALLRSAGAPAVETAKTGLLVPNKAPTLAIPLTRWLEATPLVNFGFYIRAVIRLDDDGDATARTAPTTKRAATRPS